MQTEGRSALQISVLGSVGVASDGSDLELGIRLRRLLAALAATPGSVVAADRLVDVVWSGEPPRGADRTLRSYVTRLRKAIDPGRPGLIVHRQPGYVLELAPDELDSALFEAELDEALQLLRTQDGAAALRILSVAIGRWRGPAFSGFAHEDWARPAAVRLEERLIESREARIDAYVSVGRASQAVADAQSLVEAEPLRERSREGLMRALYAAGRQAEALRVYATYRAFLAEETGLSPSESMVELEGRIARNERGLTGGVPGIRGYEIGERIGQGAFAVVHRAVQPGLDRDVAMKIIRAELADQPEFIRRFEHEAQMVARVEHPNVVPLIDFWREPGAAYVVMRLLRGGTVEHALRRSGPYSRDEFLAALADVGGALAAAHRAGVVHGDVRPANLLLDGDGSTYLADFAVAIPTAANETLPIRSPGHAAPEVLRGDPPSPTSDVLSLGITSFEMLTGRLPFAETTDRVELVRRQLEEALPSVRATRSDLPPGVDDVIARATAKAPGDRFATVAGLTEALTRALTAPRTRGARTMTEVDSEPIDNPYVGLNAFDEHDASRFFGRERLISELVERVGDRRLVAVVGPSGSGKSSVVRAGLIPAIRRGAVTGSDEWYVTTFVPGGNPFDALETALLRVAVNPPASLRDQLAQPGGMIRSIRRVLPRDGARILLVVDQFEELFTLVHDEELRHRFLDELAGALTAEPSPLRVVVTMRADHYDAPLRHQAIAGLVTDGTVTVRPMTPDELGRAIASPARDLDVEVEEALVAELVAGVSARPGALPLLQFALTELFERRIADVMLLSTHHELGGLAGGLAATADRLVERVGPENEVEVRRIFGRLVALGRGKEDTRRRALRSEFGSSEQTARLLDALVAARLLTTDRDPASREVTVEIAHEALLRDWPRLRRWIDEDRNDLALLHVVSASSAEWRRSDADVGELARGGRLESVAELATRHPDWLARGEREWIDASIVAAEANEAARSEARRRERRQNRHLRLLLTAAGCLLVAAIVVGAVSLVLRSRAIESERAASRARELAETERADASEARDVAESERSVAQAARDESDAARAEAEDARIAAETARDEADVGRLVALSSANAVAAPDLSILLAMEANRRSDVAATQSALLTALAVEPRLERVLPLPLDDATNTAFSADSSTAVAWRGFDGTVAFFDPSTGRRIGATASLGLPIQYIVLSGDGSTAAIGLVGESTRVVRVDEEGLVPIIDDVEGFPYALDQSGDVVAVGLTIGLPEGQGIVRYVETATGAALAETSGPWAEYVELSPPGDRAVLWAAEPSPGGPRHSVSVVDTATGVRQAKADADGFVTASELTADGRVVTGLVDGSVEVRQIDATGGLGAARRFPGHHRGVGHIESGDDSTFVTAGGDGEIRFWSGPDRVAADSINAAGLVNAISTDGSRVIVARDAGSTLLSYTLDDRNIVEREIETSNFGLAPDVDVYWNFELDADGAGVRLVDFETGVQTEIDLSAAHPGGMAPFAVFRGDSPFVLTVDRDGPMAAITAIDGSAATRRIDLDDVQQRLGSDVATIGRTGSPRVSADGERLFMLTRIGLDTWSAGWFDLESGRLLAGPVDVPVGGTAVVLDDGSVAVGSDVFPLAILPPDLDGEPILVEQAAAMVPLHHDAESDVLLVGGSGGGVGLLDTNSNEVRRFVGASGPIVGGAISPDGSRLAVVSSTEGLIVFDVESGERLGVPILPEGGSFGGSRGARWSDDGTGVWFGPGGGPVRIVTDPERWREIGCEIVGRDLTPDEWADYVSVDTDPVPMCS